MKKARHLRAVKNDEGSEKPAQISRKLFGTDGVRGVANAYPMTAEMALSLGRAAAYQFRRIDAEVGHRHRILIGKDTRLSGYMIESALVAGICSMGVDAMLVGPMPTPGVAYLTSSMRCDAGIVISASHNPYQDNGIKFFARDGFKLPDEVEANIEDLVFNDRVVERPTADAIGKAYRIDDALGRYISYLKETFPKGKTLDGLRIVLDCAHGAAYRCAPAVFQELGAKVFTIGVAPDGSNINDGVGALHPETLQKAVLDRGAHLGIALDGDADRVIISDEKGRVVDGDQVMAIIAGEWLKKRRLKKRTLVTTVMSNLGLDLAIGKKGGKVIRTAVGDRYVVEAMRKGDYNLGGEQSGHIICLDHATTGDGTIAALQILAILIEAGRPLSELANHSMDKLPQLLVNVKTREKKPIESLANVQLAILAGEKQLKGKGRVFVRWSGTENLCRVLVEGPSDDVIRRIADNVVAEIKTALG